eukprot:scaffold12053_cov99-Isochrysis_galbana.AAC.2
MSPPPERDVGAVGPQKGVQVGHAPVVDLGGQASGEQRGGMERGGDGRPTRAAVQLRAGPMEQGSLDSPDASAVRHGAGPTLLPRDTGLQPRARRVSAARQGGPHLLSQQDELAPQVAPIQLAQGLEREPDFLEGSPSKRVGVVVPGARGGEAEMEARGRCIGPGEGQGARAKRGG